MTGQDVKGTKGRMQLQETDMGGCDSHGIQPSGARRLCTLDRILARLGVTPSV